MAAQGYLYHLPILEVARDFVTDPCNPMTCNASLLTLSACSSSEASLSPFNSETRKPSPVKELNEGLAVWHKGRLLLHQKEEKLAMLPDAGPQSNQLPGEHRLFLQKEEEELAVGPISPGDIPLRRGCA